MSLDQIAALVLIIGVFVGLVAYRTRQERRKQQQDGTAPASPKPR